ncbi:probable phosphoserine aminotransferase isoform X1 [Hydra vulgaris]|uniref:probable phosphoserine aminotransferase isoform X1 n=1 Tax=Hydra vulgaris TaxID=6087 RepID=UPI001F5EF678|nr:probable phosphoserine aminotransferase [Hydra vulgaris]
MSFQERVVNFFPGPSALPIEVLQQASNEMLNYNGMGYGVMEMSHRSSQFISICNQAEADTRELLNIPENYKILFLQGGCTGMFAAVAMNFLTENGIADYLVTGTWSEKAASEASKYGRVNLVVPKVAKYTGIPPTETWQLSKDADYFYYCSNETIGGIEFDFIPETNGKPLVCDMSSNIMTRKLDISKFACIIAGAQKLLGPAGVVLVIVREDLIGKQLKICPSIWNFKEQVELGSSLNTPPCYSIYITGLVLKWMKKLGGLEYFEKQTHEKSQLLYNTIADSKGFYTALVEVKSQSRLNISFRVGGPNGDESVEKSFVQLAKERGLDGLSGHRSVGGCRASIYNTISLADVERLSIFMKEFQHCYQN